MTVPFEMGDHSSIDALIHRHNTRHPSGNRYDPTKTEEDNGCTQIFRAPEIRQSRIEARRERDATAEKGNPQIRKERKDSKKP
jgi:hypothetical protein